MDSPTVLATGGLATNGLATGLATVLAAGLAPGLATVLTTVLAKLVATDLGASGLPSAWPHLQHPSSIPLPHLPLPSLIACGEEERQDVWPKCWPLWEPLTWLKQ